MTDVQDLGELIENEVSDEPESVQVDDNSPTFPVDVKELANPGRCTSCGDKISGYTEIDGLCPTCALRKLRYIESRLMDLNKIKPNREYCCLDGHGELNHIKAKPEWNGVISVNGIKLYPVFPLCTSCINIVNAFLVSYLEERGFVRAGSNHHKDNDFLATKMPLTATQKIEYKKRLDAFMASARLHVLEKSASTNAIYKELISRRRFILKREERKCREEKERKQQENQSQLEEKEK